MTSRDSVGPISAYSRSKSWKPLIAVMMVRKKMLGVSNGTVTEKNWRMGVATVQ